jgi:hypothetical protein
VRWRHGWNQKRGIFREKKRDKCRCQLKEKTRSSSLDLEKKRTSILTKHVGGGG